jgi:hypothetical protein
MRMTIAAISEDKFNETSNPKTSCKIMRGKPEANNKNSHAVTINVLDLDGSVVKGSPR